MTFIGSLNQFKAIAYLTQIEEMLKGIYVAAKADNVQFKGTITNWPLLKSNTAQQETSTDKKF